MADMIKEIRLKRANQLLQNKAFQVSEVAYMVGFNDPYYFSKNYKARFGYSPRERKKINTPDTTN
jgi:transcriptional regulator GlxA family with amidase domain